MLTLKGPSGWNNNQPDTTNYNGSNNFVWWRSGTGSTNAITGTYSLETTVDGTIFSSSFQIDATKTIESPSSITPANVTTTSISASWSAIVGANSYVLEVWNDTDKKNAFNQWNYVGNTTATVTGTALDPAKTYYVQVHSFNTNVAGGPSPTAFTGTLPAQFNVGFNRVQLVGLTGADNEEGSAGTLTMIQGDPTRFNALSDLVGFAVSGATLDTAPESVLVYVNNKAVPQGKIALTTNQITLSGILIDGRNEIEINATDGTGKLLTSTAVLWAGGQTLTVSALDSNNQPVPGTNVIVSLGDDQSVQSTAITSAGQVVFNNLPARTIAINASAAGNLYATFATIGSAGFVQLKLKGIDPPSLIDNNDFSKGLDGWTIGSAPVN